MKYVIQKKGDEVPRNGEFGLSLRAALNLWMLFGFSLSTHEIAIIE